MTKAMLVLALFLAASPAWAKDDRDAKVTARVEASNEVPAVSSPARGRFRATIDDAAETIDYEFSYDGLQANILQSHIHFAQPNVNGAIVVWLCGTTANPGPAGTQVCPQSGTITGTIRPANILTVSAQGIATGEFAELVAAIRNGLTYVNIHTVQSPAGEVRGQLKVRD